MCDSNLDPVPRRQEVAASWKVQPRVRLIFWCVSLRADTEARVCEGKVAAELLTCLLLLLLLLFLLLLLPELLCVMVDFYPFFGEKFFSS